MNRAGVATPTFFFLGGGGGVAGILCERSLIRIILTPILLIPIILIHIPTVLIPNMLPPTLDTGLEGGAGNERVSSPSVRTDPNL